ncbi:MAG TPA: oligosaccharide flippase family protein [Tangfeifania sp.]|nr:oligosaccharide flippase family protein [Tangfeifania sp.]
MQNLVGDQSYGLYFALFNFSMILNILLDLGITNYNNRNIARHNYLLSKHLSNIVGLKLVLAIVYAVFSLTIAFIIGYDKVQIHLLLFLIFNQFLVSFTLYLRSNISGLHLFRTDSLVSVLDRSIMIAICSVLLFSDFFKPRFTIEWFVYAQTAAYVLTAIITFLIVLKKSGRIKVRFNTGFFVVFLRKSYPYALLILLMSLYNRIDSVMLERLLPGTTGEEQAGIYAQAFRLLDAVAMFGVLFAGLLLPIFSKMLKQHEPIGDMVKLSYSLLIVPAVVVAISSVYYDGEIMSLLYTSNTAFSSDILGILMIGFTGIATTYIFGTLLTANGSLKQLNIMAFSGMVLNVVLNLILIHRLQAYGSAYSSLVTQLFTGAVQVALAVYILRLKIEWMYIFKLLFFVGAVILFGWLSEFLSNWVYGYLLMIFVSIIFAFFLGLISIKDLYKIIRYE